MKRLLAFLLLLSTPGWAAISATSLTNGETQATQSSYTTASISPNANDLILIGVRNFLNTGNGATVPTVSGDGLTWVQVATLAIGTTTGTGRAHQLTLFRALSASPTSGVLTISFGATSQLSCSWVVDDISGVSTSGTNGSGAVSNVNSNGTTTAATYTGTTVTMGTFGSVSDETYGVSFVSATGTTQTAGTSMARLNNQTGSTNGSIADEWSNGNGNVSPVTMTFTSTSLNWGIIGIELVLPAAGGNCAACNLSQNKVLKRRGDA